MNSSVFEFWHAHGCQLWCQLTIKNTMTNSIDLMRWLVTSHLIRSVLFAKVFDFICRDESMNCTGTGIWKSYNPDLKMKKQQQQTNKNNTKKTNKKTRHVSRVHKCHRPLLIAQMTKRSGCINFNNYFPNTQSDLLYILTSSSTLGHDSGTTLAQSWRFSSG